ncbi:muscular LMNA-interacting protein isoform X4 [Antennarius striatus]|uniref:muscular LMNA-interacting protein isoform X4 n=1 Tax=Antennarius striatus TaxID=241820 RepID=UPI0035B3F8B7
MDNLNKTSGKGHIGASSQPSIFTFLPQVQKLPAETIIVEGQRSGALTENAEKDVAVSHVETTGDMMSDRGIFKVEKVFIKDFVEGGAGNTIQMGTKLQLKPSLDDMGCIVCPSAGAQAGSNLDQVAAGTASMETAVDKGRDISQWQHPDTAGLDESHKIKLSYKSLAAIPTNSLLLDQQAIDEQVERGGNLDVGSTPGGYAVDTHAEMCSPAQLRQQSEELYAVIDEILTNSLPTSLHSSRSSTPNTSLQINSFHKSLGRETKYASLCSLYPSTGMERNLTESTKTKPGVIRPMTAIPTLMVEDKEECHPNPGWRYEVKETFTDKKKMETGKDFYTSSKPQILREEERKPGGKSLFSQCDLQITESDERFTHPVKAVPTSFRPTEEQTEFFQTHI